MQQIFSRHQLVEKIVIQAADLTSDYENRILQKLRSKYEGVCSHNGLIRVGSIEIENSGGGTVRSFSLNGDVEFLVTFLADVLNLATGSIIECRVVNTNRMGVMALLTEADVTLAEIIIVRGGVNGDEVDPRLDEVQVGHVVRVEVVGKRFQVRFFKKSVQKRSCRGVSDGDL
jgi:DNA-directed RNA polymerase subunit E'/Rpb7